MVERGSRFALLLTALLPLGLHGQAQVATEDTGEWAGLDGEALYQASCANCHGVDGRGLTQALVGFEEELPDFTDCDFAAREPDGDWVAVAHEGGPVRGFSEMMPAFRGALSPEQLDRVMGYIRTLCTNPDWPRGELNLPRALVTEKAYPEDEWVVEGGVALDDEAAGAVSSAFVYEQRFGPRSQFEVVIPFGYTPSSGTAGTADAQPGGAGLGDVKLGVKHALHHSAEAGRIFSVGAEAVLPTGDEAKGLGAEGMKAEAFASYGQIVGGDGFVQAQAGLEVPLHASGENETFARFVIGRTFTEGQWGRAWTPMLEVAALRELEDGAATQVDLIPQFQVALNTRQHVLANFGLLLPVADRPGRSVRFLAYVLLDWFDGGFFEGW